jgi:fido (protein-threonine AMPylation protein)
MRSTRKLPDELVLKYKALGNRWSELASSQLHLRILDQVGHVHIDRLKIAHRSIFPDSSPWAGKLRKEHVYIVDTHGTVARIVDLAEAETKMSTIAPERIDDNLQRLFGHWNQIVEKLCEREAVTKLDEVAHFHHEFELIHPFADGNGRIGRMLLEEQLAQLFGEQITFRPERQSYYLALRASDMGSINNLKQLIREELEKFNVAI